MRDAFLSLHPLEEWMSGVHVDIRGYMTGYVRGERKTFSS